MTQKKIDFTKLSIADSQDLFNFLSYQNDKPKFWRANKTYKFDRDEIIFSHHLIWRKRKNAETGSRYEVMPVNMLASGGYGYVYNVTGTLALDFENIRFKQNTQRPRVVKIQYHSDKNPVENAKAEHDISKLAGHMAVKMPTTIENVSYTAMKKLPGTELISIIDQSLLSIAERIELSIAILKVYTQQIEHKNIIHHDIKSANIMVDLKAPVTVNYLDFGFSTTTSGSNKKILCGTIGFIAPEKFTSTPITSKTDIFSLARVLAELWGENVSRCQMNNRNNREEAYNLALSPSHNNLFPEKIGRLSKNEQEDIRTILLQMSNQNPEARPTAAQAIEAFKKIRPESAAIDVKQQFANISYLLKKLERQAQNLQNRKFEELGNKCHILAIEIAKITNDFETLSATDRRKEIENYLNTCNAKIAPLKQEMARHRDINYILANLALAIAGLGVFYLIAITCNKISTGNWLFFSKPKSLALAENIEQGVQQIASAII